MVKRYGGLGFLGINVDPAYGGLGLSNLEALLVVEEFAKISGAVAFPVFEACAGPVKAIERFGSETLKQRAIPPVCRGEAIIAISMSEAEAGTALTDLRTRGTIEGDTVVLNGAKRWCSGGAMPTLTLSTAVFPMRRARRALAPFMWKRTRRASASVNLKR